MCSLEGFYSWRELHNVSSNWTLNLKDIFLMWLLCRSASIFREADQALWRLVSLEEEHAACLYNQKTLGVAFLIWSKNMSHILTTVKAPILSCSIAKKEEALRANWWKSRRQVTQALLTQRVAGLNPQSILCCRWDKDSNTERLWGFYACCASTPGNTIHAWYCLHVLCSQSTDF